MMTPRPETYRGFKIDWGSHQNSDKELYAAIDDLRENAAAYFTPQQYELFYCVEKVYGYKGYFVIKWDETVNPELTQLSLNRIKDNICLVLEHDFSSTFTRYQNEERKQQRLEKSITRNTKDMRYQICSEQKWRCNICNCKLKFSKDSPWDGEIAHIDHIWPFADRHTYPKGAEFINERENLQALCQTCNLKKRKNKS